MRLIIHLIIISALAFVSCNNQGVSDTSKQELTVSAENASVKYQCPMECEGDTSYTTEGKCPVCEMDLAKL